MEKAKELFNLTEEESSSIRNLTFKPHRVGIDPNFYEDFAIRGIRVDRVEPGSVYSTFKVPSRLTDKSGKLANGAIANIVDEVGGALAHIEGLPMSVSVDMNISFLSSANANDELEITGKLLGKKGGYAGTSVLVKSRTTGELIAEGRHSLFGKHTSKM